MMRNAYESGLLTEDPNATFLAGKKGSQKGIWPDMDYAEELWKKGRSLNRERSVLACLMAHLKAMRAALEGGYDVILEDNVRILESHETYTIMRSFIDKSMSSGVRYFGYLGPRDNLEWLYEKHLPRYAEDEAPFPFTEHYNGEAVRGTSLWGAYAYMVSREAYDAILKKLQEVSVSDMFLWNMSELLTTPFLAPPSINAQDLGAVMWKGKRMKTYRIKPIDKIVPRRCHEAGAGSVRIVSKPVFFRAPMLASKIHRKFDVEFCKSTDLQLAAVGLEWERLWLTEEERATVVRFKKTGRWGDEEESVDDGLRRDDVEEVDAERKKKMKVEGGGGGEARGGDGFRGMAVLGVVGVVVVGTLLSRKINRRRIQCT